jgi:hypothetical protein
MDRGSGGIQMEAYTLGDKRITRGLKGSTISCNRMALTHFSISKGYRMKEAKVIRSCDILAIYKEYFLVFYIQF